MSSNSLQQKIKSKLTFISIANEKVKRFNESTKIYYHCWQGKFVCTLVCNQTPTCKTTVEQFNCPLSETISSFGKYGNESHYGNAVMFENDYSITIWFFFVKTKFKLAYEGSLLYQINCNRVEVSLHTFK
jgi:hypothetical protein